MGCTDGVGDAMQLVRMYAARPPETFNSAYAQSEKPDRKDGSVQAPGQLLADERTVWRALADAEFGRSSRQRESAGALFQHSRLSKSVYPCGARSASFRPAAPQNLTRQNTP